MGVGVSKSTLKRKVALTLTDQKGGKHRQITDLRVDFSLQKSHKTVQNKANIAIYNLSPDSRNFLREARDLYGKSLVHVELFVWHLQSPQPTDPIFKGFCNSSSILQRPYWVTTLYGIDGATNFRNFSFEEIFDKGTSVRAILNSLARQSGLDLKIKGTVKGVLDSDKTFSGAPLNILLELQGDHGFTFAVQDSSLLVRTPRPDSNKFTEINGTTGMIGTPSVRDGLLQVETLIDPRLLPDTFIKIISAHDSALNGKYIIRKTKTIGSNWGGKWTTSVEAVVLGKPSIHYMRASDLNKKVDGIPDWKNDDGQLWNGPK